MKGSVFINEGSVQMSVNIIQSSGCFSGVVVVVMVVVHSAVQCPVRRSDFHFSLRRYNTVAFR